MKTQEEEGPTAVENEEPFEAQYNSRGVGVEKLNNTKKAQINYSKFKE